TVRLGLLAMALAAAACGTPTPSSTRTPTATPTSTQKATASLSSPTATASPSVGSDTVWLCRPGMANNPCSGNLDTTVLEADGSTHVESAHAAADPPIDCFYVYP